MQLSDFNFTLPAALIAHHPSSSRSGCRLLSLDGNSGALEAGIFTDIVTKVTPGDLLVFNNTRVIRARLYGHKASGGKVELLVERILAHNQALVHIKASKAPKDSTVLYLGSDRHLRVEVISRQGELFKLQFPQDILSILDSIGHIPLPPYITRLDETRDIEDYQTVYNKIPGAVAAPTAGLHFDEPLLAQLRAKKVEFAFVTLHVGAGTFQPVRVTDIRDHQMHSEYAEVSADVVAAVSACKARGNKVIAVGTTSVRALESAAATECRLQPFYGDTQIFIYPGFTFNVVDALITNFHLPGSTLLMLVAAFAGYESILKAYDYAIAANFRFFSYGDAMWLTKKDN